VYVVKIDRLEVNRRVQYAYAYGTISPTLAAISRLKDKIVWHIDFGVIFALGLIVYWPAANSVVRTTPLDPLQLVSALGLAAVATLWWEIVKLFEARTA